MTVKLPCLLLLLIGLSPLLTQGEAGRSLSVARPAGSEGVTGRDTQRRPPVTTQGEGDTCSCNLLAACQAADFTVNEQAPDTLTCSCEDLAACQSETFPAPCAASDTETYNQGLHIAAVFIILAASMLGTLVPLLVKYHPGFPLDPYYICVGKCAGIGVVLACALVHMIQPASQSLVSECVPASFHEDYPAYAFLFAMIAALLMHLTDYAVERYMDIELQVQPASSSLRLPSSSESAFTVLHATSPLPTEDRAVLSAAPTDSATTVAHCMQEGHTHSVLLSQGVKRTISAYMLEFAVTSHSIIIGLQNGVASENDLKVLLIALCFHQFFEGVALGSRIADANFSHVHEFLLAFVFSVSAPIGIAIGIGINSLNPDGQTYLLTQGIFDSVCGGILLYIGFVLLLKDFPQDMERYCRKHPWETVRRAAMLVAMWVGAGGMAFIGKYL